MPHVSYFWDEIEDNVVEEFDGDTGATIASYTTEPARYGSVLSQDRGGVKRYFQFDGIGNTTEMTDSSGVVTNARRYSAFGETTASSGATTAPFGFCGRWGYYSTASTPSVSVRRRQFATVQMRWLSRDPESREAIISERHPYVYVRNAPSARSDPSGLICISQGDPDVRQCGRQDVPPPPWLLRWEAWIKMDNERESGTNGFLVQRITRAHYVTNCCGVLVEVSAACPTGTLRGTAAGDPNGPTSLVYYETWAFFNGKEFLDGSEEAFDSFGLGFSPYTAGYFSQKGELAFFPGFALPGTASAWKVRGDEIGASDLRVACPRDLPSSFEEKFEKRIVASRGIHVSWVCCPFSSGVLSFPSITMGACK